MSDNNTTPFPDGGHVDMVRVNLFEFEMTIPNADGRVVRISIGWSREIVEDLYPKLGQWLEEQRHADSPTARVDGAEDSGATGQVR